MPGSQQGGGLQQQRQGFHQLPRLRFANAASQQRETRGKRRVS